MIASPADPERERFPPKQSLGKASRQPLGVTAGKPSPWEGPRAIVAALGTITSQLQPVWA